MFITSSRTHILEPRKVEVPEEKKETSQVEEPKKEIVFPKQNTVKELKTKTKGTKY